MLQTRMTILPFLIFALCPFVIFDSDYALISCPLFKSNTLWNIFMILGRKRIGGDVSHTRNDNFVFTFGVISPSCV